MSYFAKKYCTLLSYFSFDVANTVTNVSGDREKGEHLNSGVLTVSCFDMLMETCKNVPVEPKTLNVKAEAAWTDVSEGRIWREGGRVCAYWYNG